MPLDPLPESASQDRSPSPLPVVAHATDDLLDARPQRTAANPAGVYLARLSEGSRRTMRQALSVIATYCVYGVGEAAEDGADEDTPAIEPEAFPWERIRAEHAKAIRAYLAARYRYSTANKTLSALRGVLREAWELGLMTTDDYHRAAAVRAVKGERPPQATGRALRQAELRQLIEACLTPTVQRKGEPPTVTPKDHRDAALVAAGYGCGLRRHEMAGLQVGDLDLVQRRFTIRGKGNKERVVPIPPGAVRALQDYLTVRGNEPGPLFARAKKGGEFVRKNSPGEPGGDAGSTLAGITDQAVYHVLRRRSEEAAVAPFSPHDLRRTYIGDLLDEGADLSVAQKLAGHASPSTTAGYDRRGERAKEQAAARLNVPYK